MRRKNSRRSRTWRTELTCYCRQCWRSIAASCAEQAAFDSFYTVDPWAPRMDDSAPHFALSITAEIVHMTRLLMALGAAALLSIHVPSLAADDDNGHYGRDRVRF